MSSSNHAMISIRQNRALIRNRLNNKFQTSKKYWHVPTPDISENKTLSAYEQSLLKKRLAKAEKLRKKKELFFYLFILSLSACALIAIQLFSLGKYF